MYSSFDTTQILNCSLFFTGLDTAKLLITMHYERILKYFNFILDYVNCGIIIVQGGPILPDCIIIYLPINEKDSTVFRKL
jgi:hypothetical protein